MGRTKAQHLVQAWRDDPVLRPSQLTHAARRGHLTAMCGVEVSAWGDDWPETGDAMMSGPRCQVCTQSSCHEMRMD